MAREEIKINISVSTSSDDIVDWNRSRIVEVLMRETYIDKDTAEKISEEVEGEIVASGIRVTTAALIREMVDAKLLEKGLEKERKRHVRLGMPVYDVEQVIQFHNKENANVPHSPEATNLTIAETIKKQYALNVVFSEKVGHAHLCGDLHIHNLGLVDRPHSSLQSLEYIKCFGLNLPGGLSVSKPARNADVLISHLVRFSAVLQSHFAGEIGWDGVSILMAPYLSGLSDRDVTQLAQKLLFDFSQQAVARGGQPVFADIHLYWDIPRHLATIPAIGPGGETVGKGYAEYQKEARRFLTEILRVYLAGDGAGRPFFFPRPVLHVGESFWSDPEAEEVRMLAARVAAEKGNPHFFFERDKKAWLA
ncbi:MAG: anaerobic ribonucleoside-triphosphate reductase, partial [Nitrospirota bacterium]|nr:anaerobic ribonucleoside-triphosphate reductase [Nitrospirota bacterium]